MEEISNFQELKLSLNDKSDTVDFLLEINSGASLSRSAATRPMFFFLKQLIVEECFLYIV